MDTVLIVDVETTGLDREKDAIVEIGYVLWSVKHATMLEVFSVLCRNDGNAAEEINGIPPAPLVVSPRIEFAIDRFQDAATQAQAIVAHNAAFDRAFIERHVGVIPQVEKPWICTSEDFVWPKPGPSRSLRDIALAHGLAITHLHRAVNDCLLVSRLFERVQETKGDVAARLELALIHAQAPKATYKALVSFADNHLAKAAGFRWNPEKKAWLRLMGKAEVDGLPFEVKEIG